MSAAEFPIPAKNWKYGLEGIFTQAYGSRFCLYFLFIHEDYDIISAA